MVEILVVVGIIALLTGMLIPAVTMVKKAAKEAKQKAQFAAIELGLEAFKSDFGDYPPSDPYTWEENTPSTLQNTAGALKLAEAMLGRDLLGVHPDTGFRVDGTNRWEYVDTASPPTTHAPTTYNFYDRTNTMEVEKRKGRYVEIDVANPAFLNDAVGTAGSDLNAAADCPILGDVFGKGKEFVRNNTRIRSGRPILYYRANLAFKIVTTDPAKSAYRSADNDGLLSLINSRDSDRLGPAPGTTGFWNPLAAAMGTFVKYVADPRATIQGSSSTLSSYVPYRPDSYILVSAGADGFYGTSDDIRNFGK